MSRFLDVFLEACWKEKAVVVGGGGGGSVNVNVYVVVCTQSLHFISSQQGVLYCTKEDALNTGFLSRGFRTFTQQQQQQQTWIDQLMSFTAHSIPVYTKRFTQLIS